MTGPQPPDGCIGLGKLIESLMSCLDEPEIDEQALVSLVPEFGRAREALFASGVGIMFPAGRGWSDYRPRVEIQWRRSPEADLDAEMKKTLGKWQPALYKALERNGYTVGRLRRLETELELFGEETWHGLLDVPNIGPCRLLELVNYFRGRGEELSWFASFDDVSKHWAELKGRGRVPAPDGC